MTEQDFIDLINSDATTDPERLDRYQELIYADWLDEQGDPRGEAWRVLIQDGKRPVYDKGLFDWYESMNAPSGSLYELLGLGIEPGQGPKDWFKSWSTYFAAMNAAAIAWVRHHVDAEFSVVTEMGD